MTLSDRLYIDVRGGGIYNSGTLTLTNSLVADITVTFPGRGSGVYNGGILTVNNSTITGNSGAPGLLNASVANVNSSTLTDGIDGSANLRYTIVADSAGCGSKQITSLGYNLIQNATGCSVTATDLVGVNPQLGPLQDNGGPTSTHALQPGSPAIDGGSPQGCQVGAELLQTDQRGFARCGRCDIGAYEVSQPLTSSAKRVDRSVVTPGRSLTYTIALRNACYANLPAVTVTDSVPAALSFLNESLAATGGSPSFSKDVVSWSGPVQAGEAVSITFSATANQIGNLGMTEVLLFCFPSWRVRPNRVVPAWQDPAGAQIDLSLLLFRDL